MLECDCCDSPFNYKLQGIVVTGDLNIISNYKLRKPSLIYKKQCISGLQISSFKPKH